MKRVLSTFVVMTPVAKARPRMTKSGHTYTPSKTTQAEFRLEQQVGELWGKPPLEGPTRATLTVFLPRPKNAKSKPFPLTRPDADNYAKLVLDSLNQVMWKDDSIVVDLVVHKRFINDEHPHPGFLLEVDDLSAD